MYAVIFMWVLFILGWAQTETEDNIIAGKSNLRANTFFFTQESKFNNW
jgi:hypothetical protein